MYLSRIWRVLVAHLGEHLTQHVHAARVWCGDWATYPDQTTVLTTKGFSLHRDHFRRGESLGHSGKTHCKSSVRCACGADTPPHLTHICRAFDAYMSPI